MDYTNVDKQESRFVLKIGTRRYIEKIIRAEKKFLISMQFSILMPS